MARRYRLKARAQRQDENRRRIVEAAYRLHMTVGPSRATASAIARLAGVKRPTVQRHFPDLLTLFMACSLHGQQLDPPPDPGEWQRIAEPRARLLTALGDQYPYYRRNRTVFGDIDKFLEAPGLGVLYQAMDQQKNWQRAVLAQGWPVAKDRESAVTAALGHALDFHTWQSLALHQGLDDEEAAALMTQMVQGVADDRDGG